MARNWFAQCRPSRCSCQLRVDHHNPGLARPRVACDNAEIPRTLAGNGKAAGRNEVAVLETRNSAAKPSTASISQRRRPQRAETAVSSLSAGLVSKLYGTRGKGYAPEECEKTPEAASPDSAPSACVSVWEGLGDKRSTVPISSWSNIPFSNARDTNFCCE